MRVSLVLLLCVCLISPIVGVRVVSGKPDNIQLAQNVVVTSKDADAAFEQQKNMKEDVLAQSDVLVSTESDAKALQDDIRKQEEQRQQNGPIQSLVEASASHILQRLRARVASSSGLTVAGDPQTLLVGVLATGGVQLNAAAIQAAAAARQEVQYHGSGLPGNIPIRYTIENHAVYGGTHRVRIIGQTDLVGGVCVFVGDVCQFNLAASGTTDFSLVHETNPGHVVAHTYNFRISFKELTIGIELEDGQAQVRLCRGGADAGNCENLAPADVVTQTAATTPGTNQPFLKLVLEVTNPATGTLEYVTGPLGIGAAQNTVPNDIQDQQRALALIANTVAFELSNQGMCKNNFFGQARVWVSLEKIIVRYNTRLMDGTLGFHTPANWRLNLPSGSDRLRGLNANRNLVQSKHKWIINCGYRWYRPDIQVNVMMPLGALGDMKVGARNQAAPTHYIDLFPSLLHAAGPHAGQPITQEYYRGSQWARAQYVATELLNPTVVAGGAYVGSVVLSGPLAALTAAQPAWLMKELQGFFTIFISQNLVATELKCYRDNAVRLGNGQNKNLHFNLIKACVNDLTRSFPVAVTSVLTQWWSAAHMPGADAPTRQLALIQNIIRLLRHNTGVAANGQLGFQMVPGQGQCLTGQFDAAFRSEMERAEVSLPFKSRASWSSRYHTEDNLRLGHDGVSANRDLTGIDNWQCYHKPLPFEKAYPQQPDKNYHSTAVLVELRYPYMPINQGFLPTWGDPANIANIAPTLDLIRTVANS